MMKTLLFIWIVLFSISTFAGDYTFTNGGGDNLWTTGANWDLGTPPGVGDTVTIGSGQMVILDAATQIHELNLASATLHLNGLQLQVDSLINITNAVVDDGTFAAGTLYADSVGYYNIFNTSTNAELIIYSADWGNCNSNIYNGDVFYSHIGSTNETIVGNNIYNSTVIYETLNGRFRPESSQNSTFNGDSLYFRNHSSIDEQMRFSQSAKATLNNTILTLTGTSNNAITIASTTGYIKLNGTSNLAIKDFIDGNIQIFHMEQQNANAINLTTPDSISIVLRNDSIMGPLTVTTGNLNMQESIFFRTVDFTKIGSTTSTSQGGNDFQDVVTIENAGNAVLRMGSLNTLTNNYTTDVHYINSGTSYIEPDRRNINSLYGGNIYVSATDGSGIRFGQGGGTFTLSSGSQFIVGGAGFSVGSLRFRGLSQADATAQTLSLSGTAEIRFEQDCFWDGTVTFDSPRVYFNGGTFNNTVDVTKTSDGYDHSTGGCIFNDDVTITSNSDHRLRLASSAGNVNIYNADVTFVLTGAGSLQPAYNGNSIFNGNVNVNSNKTITFSIGSTGSSTFGGGNAQSINDLSGSFPPAFDSLIMNKTANELTLNTEISINDAANFISGILISNAANLLIFNSGAEAYNASNSSHVQGPVRKFGTQAFTFPVGKSGNRYAPIGITAPTITNDFFTAEYFDIPDYSYDTTSLDATLDHVSRCEYWILNQGGGSGNTVNVTLSWEDPRSCGVDKMSDLRVCRWDGAVWRDHSNISTTGSAASGTVTSSGISSFSPFTLGSVSSDNPLPIELTEFDAVQNGQSVNLYWATESEINNALFTIERSTDGLNWEEILYTEGAGNSTNYLAYFDVDTDPLMGNNFYRLKQTDFDGRFEYSQAIFVDFKSTEDDIEIFPNPNDGTYFNVNLNKFKDKEVLLVVRDLMGKELYSKAFFSTKDQAFVINFENQLPKGTYLVIASSADELVSKRLVIK
ncbi:MAG: T9SS type A sorting domain-containing protein [Flavobacteriales bacterium]|nr:T9SS type A sorting domain-containing protein [Flavobacteriales bacterium]